MLTSQLAFRLAFSNADRKLLNAAKDITKGDDTTELKDALKKGANVNQTDIRINDEFNFIGYQYTALMWAAHNGQLNKVKFLVEFGANVELTTASHNTALHLAAREGQLSVYIYLIEKFPALKYKKGENGLTSDEMAQRYKQEKIIEVCQKFYSNLFFCSLKAPLPNDIIKYIVNSVTDPRDIDNLKSANKTWNSFFKVNQDYDAKKALRSYLPLSLQKLDWKTIFKFYAPNVELDEKLSDDEAYHAFARHPFSVYLIGTPIKLYRRESVLEEIGSLIDIWNRPDGWKYISHSEQEIANSYKKTLSHNKVVTIFRNFNDAAQAEYQSNIVTGKVGEDARIYWDADKKIKFNTTFRHPIFEVTINNKEMISLLNNSSCEISSSAILSAKKYNLPILAHPAYENLLEEFKPETKLPLQGVFVK